MIIERSQIVAALPHYEIGEPIGRGAHGLVFAARHRRLGVARAVKALVVVEADQPGASRRFRTEAQVMTALDHPHIVGVHEYAENQAVWLLVMEYLGGGTLTDRMHSGVRPEQACGWALAVADALSAAHTRGVVHRDIKPANLLFTADGMLKVGDFGIAKLFAGTDASASMDLVGTPRYVAPEQITGARVGPGTDLYALGVTLYELLAGRSPFPAHLSVPGLLHHHMSVEPTALDEAPPAIAAVVRRALAKDVADRQPSAREFALDLIRAANNDLGPDWIARSGVPLRVDHALLQRSQAAAFAPPARPSRPAPAPSRPGTPYESATVPRSGSVHAEPAPPKRPAPGRLSRRLAIVLTVFAVLAAIGITAAVVRSQTGGDAGSPAAASTHPSSAAASTAVPAAVTPTKATVVNSFKSPSLVVQTLVFNADATRLAWADTTGTVKIWSPASGKQVGPLQFGQGDFIWGMAFDSLGTLLASADNDDTVRIWTVATGKQQGRAMTGATDVTAVAFSHDGTVLVAGGGDHKVRIWGTSTSGRPTQELSRHTANVNDVAFSPDGTRLASAGDDGVRLWDPQTGKQVAAFPNPDGAFSLVFSPDGSRFAAADQSAVVRVWDTATAKPLGSPIALGTQTNGLVVGFNQDSTQLLTNTGNTVRWWDPNTGKQLNRSVTANTTDIVNAATFSRDGTRLALASQDGYVRMFKLS